MNSKGTVDEKSDSGDCIERKKSVEDIFAGTQETIGNNTDQENILYPNYTNPNHNYSTQSSSSSSFGGGKSPSLSSSPHNSPEFPVKSSNVERKSVKSDSNISLSVSISTSEKSETTDSPESKNINSDLSQNLNEENIKLSLQDSESAANLKLSKSASKISDRAKKKTWYSVLYPSYKSRSEDFKKLFKDVPDDERLVVDYSCAVQREILVHGRLYVSQNYLCFYANIFRWETCLCIKWKDVTSITKEKTARVIPNAILICSGNEKHFFTSFTTRDKAYLMLFRVWQNALMDKQMQPQEMWQWVHNCYGDELGLTSDDEDYIDPYLCEENQQGTSLNTTTITNAIDNFSIITNQILDKSKILLEKNLETQELNDIPTIENTMGGASSDSKTENKTKGKKSSDEGYQKLLTPTEVKKKISKNSRQRDEALQQNKEFEQIPTDMSDSSDSDQNKNLPFVSTAECTSMHEGRQLVHTILPINIDSLFNLLFSKSKFLVDFHSVRKSTDMVFGEWVESQDDGAIKTRTVKLTVTLTQPVGPKTAQVTETQIMRDCSQPGELYSIDVNSVNAGIPYADSFSVAMHYCLVRTVDDHTMLSVHAQIKYKKSIWGVVKGFIERNTWAGLEDFYNALLRALQSEYCIPPAKAKSRRPRRNVVNSRSPVITTSEKPINIIPVNNDIIKVIDGHITPTKVSQQLILTQPTNKYKCLSWLVIALLMSLIILNVILLFKLWKLENRSLSISQAHNILTMKNLPKNHKDWIELLKQQESLHESEMRKWQIVLQTAIELLKKVSVVCKTIINNGNLTEFINNIHNEL